MSKAATKFFNVLKGLLIAAMIVLAIPASGALLHQLAFTAWDIKLLVAAGYWTLLISTILSLWWKNEKLLSFLTIAGWIVYGLLATPEDDWSYFHRFVPPLLILFINLVLKTKNKPADQFAINKL